MEGESTHRFLLAVVAIAVTIWTAGAASTLAGTLGFAAGTTGNAIAAAGLSGAAGSIASQAVGVTTGIQDKFSWNAVAMSALSAGLTTGLSLSGPLAGASTAMTAARAVVSSAMSQGIGVATGLQKEFSWAGVAAAGVGSLAGGAVRGALGKAGAGVASVASHTADGIAQAAMRSLLDGDDFGDAMLASLPSIISAVVGDGMRAGRAEAPLEVKARYLDPIKLQPAAELAAMRDAPDIRLRAEARAPQWSDAISNSTPGGSYDLSFLGSGGYEAPHSAVFNLVQSGSPFSGEALTAGPSFSDMDRLAWAGEGALDGALDWGGDLLTSLARAGQSAANITMGASFDIAFGGNTPAGVPSLVREIGQQIDLGQAAYQAGTEFVMEHPEAALGGFGLANALGQEANQAVVGRYEAFQAQEAVDPHGAWRDLFHDGAYAGLTVGSSFVAPETLALKGEALLSGVAG